MSSAKHIKPYGSWKSPVSGTSLTQSSLRLGQLQIDGTKIFWTEGRPAEKGRTALMMRDGGQAPQELSHPDWDVRTRAHEYGGGAFLVDHSRIFYVENHDQQIYEILENGDRQRLTNNPNFRYADMILDSKRHQLFVVGEDHSNPEAVANMLLRIPLDGEGKQVVVASGHDFYSNPQLSPDGNQLAFLSWDHPNMPWDATQLWLGKLNELGDMNQLHSVAGADEESIFQPLWDPDGTLYFISDRSGWWNIYKYSDENIRTVLDLDAEFGLPQWIFGMSTYAVLEPGMLVANYRDLSGSHLVQIDVKQGVIDTLAVPYTDLDQVKGVGSLITFIGSTAEKPSAMVSMDVESKTITILRNATETHLKADNISKPELISFEPRAGDTTYAWFYAPKNPLYKAPKDEKPPLIVLSHGGPTAYSPGVFSLIIQYWTTRGYAIVDVNYSGSTGFGRKYRERLNGSWGIRDVEDCSSAAFYLAQRGDVDPDRLIIKGSSAGGYTTLAALTFTDVFKAGASYYGIGDLELLAKDTHKFESRYLDHLVGEYPKEIQTYLDRSPIQHTDQLDCPVIFLQGLDDPVVPPNQAEIMVTALQEKGIPVAYVPFVGESHGFRQASTIVKAIESECYFYSKVFGIEPADSLEAIEIYNL